ncbi:hypothetical protein MC7420_6506 [Coleofasciculus chthonoplastes PCC 7420]|uniref:Uncharacterized protein n=1 Tax=Coleofasciculus chthonoplastes PCC 7420 TaxID=118168 RepID=B4VQW4_9CYAN|nr:hypothetical protein MC7420_6506 [Coleofasciculus chthonoplastes PCC 7420]
MDEDVDVLVASLLQSRVAFWNYHCCQETILGNCAEVAHNPGFHHSR